MKPYATEKKAVHNEKKAYFYDSTKLYTKKSLHRSLLAQTIRYFFQTP